jgi:hypothetical protein
VQRQMMQTHSLDAKYEFRTFFDLENEVGAVTGDEILFDFAYQMVDKLTGEPAEIE